ncbi:MAG: hypothetical protein FWF60_03665, partial [Oscillospiraceae bacterium]|nr:hypothetical protein [Oscillospiraceae bacterium]
MRFGPEVNDALGGRLEGNIYLLPNHCAAILRALLFSRPSARLKIGGITGEAGGDIFEMDFRTPDIREFGDVLNFRRQEGFTDVRDLTRVISSKSVCAYFLRRGQNECVAIIQSTQSNAFRPRAYKTVASLPTLLPGLFAGNPLSETEKALLAAAYKEDCGTIEGILETLYKESDLCNVRQKQMLHSVISHSMNADLNRMRSEAQQHEHNAGLALRNYMDNTNAAMEKKILAEDIERRIGGMSQVVDDIMDFMKISHAAISKCLGFWARGIGYSTTGRWRLTMALVLYRPSNGPKPDVAGMKHRLQAGALLPP